MKKKYSFTLDEELIDWFNDKPNNNDNNDLPF